MAKNIFTGLNIDEIGLNHVEADTSIFTIYNKMCENGWRETIVIDAGDTDIYVHAAYVSQREVLIKKKNIYVDIRTLLTTLMADFIIQFNVITDCDHNGGFHGRGRKAVIKKVMKNSEARAVTWKPWQASILS